ncbi:hypothetical protein NE634_19060, partial [Lacrimispora saccharolytica]|nr:hypothetical protein [Lacrimispora saccharolytica]
MNKKSGADYTDYADQLYCNKLQQKNPCNSRNPRRLRIYSPYPRNEISTPAATAEPITPEILLDI